MGFSASSRGRDSHGQLALWLASPANARWAFFCCLFILALVHLTYLSMLQSAQPIRGAATSLSALARNLEGRREARQSESEEDISASINSLKHMAAGAPTVQFVCRDVKPPQGDCTDVLSKGLCNGNTLTHCLKSCGMCDVVAAMVSEAAGAKAVMTSKLTCRDEGEGCSAFVDREKCETHQLPALANCRASCHFCQQHPGSTSTSTSSFAGEAASSSTTNTECSDLVDVCPLLATSKRLCGAGPEAAWMQSVCQLSCGACVVAGGGPQQAWRVQELSSLRKLAEGTECTDYHRGCHEWALAGRCSNNQGWMGQHCRRACSMCTDALTSNVGLSKAMWKVGLNSTGHWQLVLAETVQMNKLHDPVTNAMVASGMGEATGGVVGGSGAVVADSSAAVGDVTCVNLNALCGSWAKGGECAKNPGYMGSNCKKACGLCHVPGEPNAPAPSFVWYPRALQSVMLNNGVLMPTVGFGTAGLGVGTTNAVEQALRAGFRHIDTAEGRDWYREDLVGEALQRYPLPRSSLFITTKVHPRDLGYEPTLRAFDRVLADLKLDFVDLLLLHYPTCWGDLCKALPGAAAPVSDAAAPLTFQESWRAMEELYRKNKTRAIGVSNFDAQQLQTLFASAQVKPQVLQVHMDPFAQNKELQAYCSQNGIQMVAYSSLGTQWQAAVNPVLTHPVLQSLATGKRRTVPQVVLRWVLQMGVVVIPRSSNPQHMGELMRLHDFNLTDGEVAAIQLLDGTLRTA